MELAERTLQYDPVEARERIDLALALANRLDLTEELAGIYLKLAEAEELCGDLDEATDALLRVVRLYDETGEGPSGEGIIGRPEVLLELARLERLRGRHRDALIHTREAIERYQKADDVGGEAYGLKGLADLYNGIGDTTNALSLYFDALKRGEEAGEEEIVGVCLSDIALLQSESGEHRRGIEHLQRARAIFSRTNRPALEVRALANLATMSALLGDHDAGLEYGLRAMAIYEATGDLAGLATTLANLAPIYEAIQDIDNALECNRKAYDLFEEIGETRGRGTILLNSGALYHGVGEFQNSIYITEQALEIAESSENEGLKLACHEQLSRSLEEIGDAALALEHLRKSIEMRDRIEGAERKRSLADLQAQYDLERAEREREIFRLQNSRLEQENEHKTAELTSLSMRLVEKSRFIKDVRLGIEKVREKIGAEERGEIDEILRKIKANSRSNEDWQEFEGHFRAVHHDFIDRLARRFPTLTPTELKVCTLVKTGLSSSEIAAMFHVSKRNVDTHRYRLRKKLDIESTVSLQSFLATL